MEFHVLRERDGEREIVYEKHVRKRDIVEKLYIAQLFLKNASRVKFYIVNDEIYVNIKNGEKRNTLSNA